mgnify:CR=1 FL=1
MDEIEQEKQELLKEHALLDTKITLQAQMAKLSILSQGGCESRDYWIHSGHLEALAYSESIGIDQYKPILARLAMYAKGPHQLATTKRRVGYFLDSLSNQRKDTLVQVLNEVISLIDSSISRLEDTGDGSIDDLLVINSSERETSMKETVRISSLADTEEKVKQTVFRRTFNMRGMVYSPRPYFIPGGK